MQALTQRLLHNWHWIRILRLVIGISVLVSGTQSAHALIAALGLFLTLQGLFDFGCGAGCRGGDCAVDSKGVPFTQTQDHDTHPD